MPEPRSGSRPTLEAVAALAGVSRATVSRVVNGGDGVRPHLADRVQTAIQELGYIPNHAARTLVTRRTGAVAVIIPEPEARIFSDPFFSRQIRGISKELTAHDTQLVLLLVEDHCDYDRIERYLAGGHVDGALAFSLHTDDPLPAIASRLGMPTVYGGRPGWTAGPGDEDRVTYVDADNREGAREAVRHLLGQGRLPRRAARRRARAGRRGGLHRGGRGARDGRTPGPGPVDRRGVRRQRPDGDRCAARAARARPDGSR